MSCDPLKYGKLIIITCCTSVLLLIFSVFGYGLYRTFYIKYKITYTNGKVEFFDRIVINKGFIHAEDKFIPSYKIETIEEIRK